MTLTPTGVRGNATALAALVLAAVVVLHAWLKYEPYSFLVRDAAFYAEITRGLATDLSLDQKRWQPVSWYSGKNPKYKNLTMDWSNVSVGADGTWYPKHSFVMPLFAVPFYKLFGPAGLLVFNAVCAFVLLFAAYLVAARFAPPPAALAAVLLAWLGPCMQSHTYHFSLDMFTAALVAAGTAVALGASAGRFCEAGTAPGRGTEVYGMAAGAGLLLGIALWARPTLAPLVVPVGVAIWIWKPDAGGSSQGAQCGQDGCGDGRTSADSRIAALGRLWRKEVALFLAALALPVGAAMVSSWVMFGAPWITAYDRVLTVAKGVQKVVSHRDLFGLDLSHGLERMFMSIDDGLVWRCPAALLGVAGLWSLWRGSESSSREQDGGGFIRSLQRGNRALAMALVLAVAGYLAVFLKYQYSTARFFLPWQGLLCAPLAVLLADAGSVADLAWSKLTAWLRVPVSWRWRLVAGGAAGAACVAAVLAASLHKHSAGYALYENISSASVSRDDVPCDYFNMRHQRWECSKVEEEKWEYTGLALGADECLFKGEKQPMIWFHPPGKNGVKRIVFGGAPATGVLELRYGLADSAVGASTCFSVSYGDGDRHQLCAAKAGVLLTTHIRATASAQDDGPRRGEVMLEIKSPPHSRRHLCVAGTVRGAE